MIDRLVIKLKSGINISYQGVVQFEKRYERDMELLLVSGIVDGHTTFDKIPVNQLRMIEFK